MARQIDLDKLMKYPLRRGSEHCDEKNADPRFLNGVESILEWAQTSPTLTPPNEALTLEQLREMDGEPVWVKCLKPDKYTYPPVGWRILELSFTGKFGVWNGDCALTERDYGTDWLAYRRPPVGEEEEKHVIEITENL